MRRRHQSVRRNIVVSMTQEIGVEKDKIAKEQNKVVLIFFDELDSIAISRSHSDMDTTSRRLLTGFYLYNFFLVSFFYKYKIYRISSSNDFIER